MIFKPLHRRTILRGAGVCVALPFLEAMRPRRAAAQAAGDPHFFGFFYPNGTEASKWMPQPGPLSEATLSEALVDLAGFEAEQIWPAGGPVFEDIAVIGGIDHSGVSLDIHEPALAFCAHKGSRAGIPGGPTLDQAIAEEIGGDTPYKSLAMSATNDANATQGYISYVGDNETAATDRNPAQVFQKLFTGSDEPDNTAALAAARRASVLDYVADDARRLNQRLGSEDKLRVDAYLSSISELEKQLAGTPDQGCAVPEEPPAMAGNWHPKSKAFIDLGVLAMACGLTRVVTVQYSNSWDVHYDGYDLGEGIEGLGTWSDHFISHKLGDADRATDLDGLPQDEAMRIANVRVLTTARFKARRFSYLVEKLKSYATANGTLLDDTLAMLAHENADGDSHSRNGMSYLIAGHQGGFKTGRALKVKGNTGALHASLLGYYGIDAQNYGTPMGNPISEI